MTWTLWEGEYVSLDNKIVCWHRLSWDSSLISKNYKIICAKSDPLCILILCQFDPINLEQMLLVGWIFQVLNHLIKNIYTTFLRRHHIQLNKLSLKMIIPAQAIIIIMHLVFIFFHYIWHWFQLLFQVLIILKAVEIGVHRVEIFELLIEFRIDLGWNWLMVCLSSKKCPHLVF